MISLNNGMGIIRRWKNSIINLRLRFSEIPHKSFWVSWGILFKGLGVQKGTQTPCWLRPWSRVCTWSDNLVHNSSCWVIFENIFEEVLFNLSKQKFSLFQSYIFHKITFSGSRYFCTCQMRPCVHYRCERVQICHPLIRDYFLVLSWE